jgi:hypothetical protein
LHCHKCGGPVIKIFGCASLRAVVFLVNEPVLSVKFLLRRVHRIAKAAISFVVSVRPSVCLKQLGSHWTDSHEIWYLGIVAKSVEKIKLSLKSDKNNVRVLYMKTDIRF